MAWARGRTVWRTIKRGIIAHGHMNSVYVVNEFPKSGGTWIASLLAEALGLPFHDNKTPPFGPQVLKGHFIRRGGLNHGVTVWRDGRDVMLSWYHHCFFKFADMPINHHLVDAMREKYRFADYGNVSANLPAFLEGEFKKPFYPSFTWPQFVDRWHGHPGFAVARYEKFRADPVAALHRLTEDLNDGVPVIDDEDAERIIDKFDIKKHAKGVGNFVRSGKTGGWRETYTDEALDIFNHYAGDALKVLRYA